MATISIVPLSSETGTGYRALCGAEFSEGQTPGEALDALTAKLSPQTVQTFIVIGRTQGDSFFTARQAERLEKLMSKWRRARDGGIALSPQERQELDALVEQETRAAGMRAQKLADELERHQR